MCVLGDKEHTPREEKIPLPSMASWLGAVHGPQETAAGSSLDKPRSKLCQAVLLSGGRGSWYRGEGGV